MVMEIERDQGRFKQIVRGRIRGKGWTYYLLAALQVAGLNHPVLGCADPGRRGCKRRACRRPSQSQCRS